MKKIIKSWRWKRLTDRSAWKLFVEEGGLACIAFTLLYVAFVFPTPILAEHVWLLAFVTIVYAYVLIYFISTICRACDYFELTDEQNNKCRIYVYREQSFGPYKILARYNNDEIWFKASEYKTSSEEEKYCFIYKSIDSEVWRMVISSDVNHLELGEKISDQVFKLDRKNLIVLQPFRQGLFAPVKADEFYWGDAVFIPKNARNNLKQIVDDWLGPRKVDDIPDKYLFVEYNNEYILYGFYLGSEDDTAPHVELILAETVITCDVHSKYVFVLDGTTYRLKRKEPNYCRKSNDIFLQFLHMTGMEADIMQYDEESQNRKSIAKCVISSIDFDSGEITGVAYDENSSTKVKISFDENSDAKLETI